MDIISALMNCVIETAETREARDIADGTVHVYDPEEMHTEDEVWDGANGPMPDGVWISPCGNWRTVLCSDPGNEIDTVERNLCYCPFCKKLRSIARRCPPTR